MVIPINKINPMINIIGLLTRSLKPHKKTLKANVNIDLPINLHSAFSSYLAFSSLFDVLYPAIKKAPLPKEKITPKMMNNTVISNATRSILLSSPLELIIFVSQYSTSVPLLYYTFFWVEIGGHYSIFLLLKLFRKAGITPVEMKTGTRRLRSHLYCLTRQE